MASNTISEAQFLLTELRYTLGQLHVQVLDIDDETRASMTCNGRTINMILQDMAKYEDEYQSKYRHIAPASSSEQPSEDLIRLPMEESGLAASFEHKRAETITLLERVGLDWSRELLEMVKEQVQRDREHTTQVAECRKSFFEHDERPDLREPITEEPAPHTVGVDASI